MLYYYAATLYIDIGCESIHPGQMEWTSENDLNKESTFEFLSMMRAYAYEYARHLTFLHNHAHFP